MAKSKLEVLLAEQIAGTDLPAPQREYRFAAMHVGPGRGVRARLKAAGLRDWRFDFAWPAHQVAAEVEGGTWAGGRHTRGDGFEGDCQKYNAALLLGWRVLRFTAGMLDREEAVPALRRALDGAQGEEER